MRTDEKPFKCSKCMRRFAKSSGLTVHMRSHTSKKLYKCSGCDKSFTRSKDLKQHMRTHTEKRPCKCSECGKGFRWPSEVGRHMRIHTGERPYKCAKCSKGFKQSDALAKHVQTHTVGKPYKCSLCHKCRKTWRGLVAHMLIHSGEKPYRCTSKVPYDRHLLEEHGEGSLHQCHLCQKKFPNDCNLRCHLKSHEPKKFACSQCPATFSFKYSVKRHEMRHAGVKLFGCGFCGQMFYSRSSVICHVRRLHQQQ
jgi:KRAB domain-containing zinc finger protein